MARRLIRWDDNTIKEAINHFLLEKGQYPTTHDFQFTKYLPDPDTIRRLYGGIPAFRKRFGFAVEDYTRGNIRAELNRKLNDRAKLHEGRVQQLLISQFGEICVHKEREFAYRSRVDFQIYHEDGVFGVDTFYAKNRATMINIYNIKFSKYKKFTLGPVFLVCMNPELDQGTLDDYIQSRRNEIMDNIRLVSEESFSGEVLKFRPRKQI